MFNLKRKNINNGPKFVSGKEISEFLGKYSKPHYSYHLGSNGKLRNISYGKNYSKKELKDMFAEQIRTGEGNPNVTIGMCEDTPIRISEKYNTLVIGSVGKEKIHSYLISTLLQANQSFIVPDCNGKVQKEIGGKLLSQGYEVITISTEDIENYNPLRYLYDLDGNVDKQKVHQLVETMFGKDYDSSSIFVKMEMVLLKAIICYCLEFLPAEECNLGSLIKLCNMDENTFGQVFEITGRDNPNAKYLEFYRIHMLSTERTRKDIRISLRVRLQAFSLLNQKENIGAGYVFDKINITANKKLAIFIAAESVIVSKEVTEILTTMIYNQIFDSVKSMISSLEIARRISYFNFVIDVDMPVNISFVERFEYEFGMNYTLIANNKAQIEPVLCLEKKYIFPKLKMFVFLGSDNAEVCEFFSEMLGKTTIIIKSSNGRASREEQYLMSSDELMTIDSDHQIIIVDGYNFFLKKINE